MNSGRPIRHQQIAHDQSILDDFYVSVFERICVESLLLRLEGTLIELEMRFKVDRITLRLNIDDADL